MAGRRRTGSIARARGGRHGPREVGQSTPSLRGLALFGVLAALGVAALVLPSIAGAGIWGSEGKIAFQRMSTSGDYDIWIRDARVAQCNDGQDNDDDGSIDLADLECQSLGTHHNEEDAAPTELRLGAVILPAGSDPANDTEPAWAPAECTSIGPCGSRLPWSADLVDLEQVLAFASDRPTRGGSRDIYAAVPGQAMPANLTDSSPADDDSPSFNRFGDMAFDSSHAGNRDIYALSLSNADSSGPYWCPLTADAADESNPEWSPDGSHIAYERPIGGETQIWVMDVNVDAATNTCVASGHRPITAGQPPSLEPSWFDWDVAAGALESAGLAHRIAFSGSAERADSDIHYIEQGYVDGAKPTNPFADLGATATLTLFHEPHEDRGPSWSPHGSGLVFASDRLGRYAVYFLGQDGEGLAGPLTTPGFGVGDLNPAVQPRPQADVTPRKVCGRACQRRRRASAASVTTAPVPLTRSDQRASTKKKLGRCTIRGDRRDNRLPGTRRADVICGLGGDDLLIGARGNDTLRGGSGRDTLRGGSGRDKLFGEAGRDTLFGGVSSDRLVGGSGVDRLFGQAGADRVFARDGRRDLVSGGPGADAIVADRRDTRDDVRPRLP